MVKTFEVITDFENILKKKRTKQLSLLSLFTFIRLLSIPRVKMK